jgi:hypothetical protein
MLNRMKPAVVGALCALVVCASTRAEMIDSPQYKAWAKFKVGTKVTYQNQIAAGQMAMSQTSVQTIKEITPDKVVLDISSKMDMGGMSRDLPARTQDVPAKVDQKDEYLPADFSGSVKEAGTETIEVGGKKYECKVYEFKGEQTAQPGARGPTGAGGAATGKFWRNEEVPGGLVKMTMQTSAQGMQADITLTMTSVEEK